MNAARSDDGRWFIGAVGWRSTSGDNRRGVGLRYRLRGRRLFDMPAAQALETRVHPDHVHAALRTGRSDFKASHGAAPRWAEQLCAFPLKAKAERSFGNRLDDCHPELKCEMVDHW
jgi:hypothetical protein